MPSPVASHLAEGDGPFVVALDRFQGPLDLLLHLIRAQDIDVFDIPIAEITAQFIAAIRGIDEKLSLERAGEFLEMAATLVRIKAQMLLPRRSDLLEEEDPRSELVRRLLEYESFREVARALASAQADRALHYGVGYVPPRPTPSASDRPLETTFEELLAVAAELPEPREEQPHRAPMRAVTVDEKIEQWFEVLKRKARTTLQTFVSRWTTRMHAIMSFLAALELAKRGSIWLRQERHFGDLWIYPREDDENS